MRYLLLIISLYITFNATGQSQITWQNAIDISGETGHNMHPRMSLDGKGNPMVIWGNMDDESVMFTRWNGSSFNTPKKLNPEGFTVATASWMGPDIASKGDTVYVVLRQTPETTDTSKHIFIFTSFDAGQNFAGPVQVDFIGDSLSRFPTVTVDEKGNPVVAFMKFNKSFMESKWVVARSEDYGKTFFMDVKASGYSGMEAEVCDCCPGAIINSGTTTALLYRDNLKNIRDIWVGISTNSNKSFPAGFNIDKNKWLISSCPSSGPDGIITGDSLYSVFMSGGSGKVRTYLSKSSVKDASSSIVTRFTGEINLLGQQNFPRISSYNKAAAIVWRQSVGGVAHLPIMFTTDITKGFPSAYELVDVADVTNTDVAVGKDNVYVVWQDDKFGTVKLRSGSYSSSPNSINENIKDNLFTIYPIPATNAFTVNLTNRNCDIIITDILGRTVYSLLNIAENKIEIGTATWKKGLYMITVKAGANVSTQKLIIQ
ncbi:MAG: T9SS type A sorting domain-containing protein [Bacteroidia bacterium]